MYKDLATPIVQLSSGELVRKSGLFYRKRIRLTEVLKIVAAIRDAITHEELVVMFFDDSAHSIWISEFDKNFDSVMRQLSGNFEGMLSPRDLLPQSPFEHVERLLWEKINGSAKAKQS